MHDRPSNTYVGPRTPGWPTPAVFGWRAAVDVCFIHCPDSHIKPWAEIWVIKVLWCWIIHAGKLNIFFIEWPRWKGIKNFSEVPITLISWSKLLYSRKNYIEMVSFECWNCSPTCLIERPVTHMYRNIATCSWRVTNLLSSRWQRNCNSSTRRRNTCKFIPSSVQMQSGWL